MNQLQTRIRRITQSPTSSSSDAAESSAGRKPASAPSTSATDTKEVLLLSSGLLTLVLGFVGLLMYSDEGPAPATASPPVSETTLTAALSAPMHPSPTPETDGPEPLGIEPPTPLRDDVFLLPEEPTLINFDVAESTLSEEAKAALLSTLQHLPSNWGGTVRIEGHTDTRGTAAFNHALGKERADAVRSYLVGMGIEQDAITSESLGGTAPLCEEDTPSCHGQNRRVHVQWVSASGVDVSPTVKHDDLSGNTSLKQADPASLAEEVSDDAQSDVEPEIAAAMSVEQVDGDFVGPLSPQP